MIRPVPPPTPIVPPSVDLQKQALNAAAEVQERGIPLKGADLVAWNACIAGYPTTGDIERLKRILENID